MEQRNKNILLAVTGMSPAVVTETVYALYKEGEQIDEIQIITTRKGKDQAWLSLGVRDAGSLTPLEQLQADYNLPPITFTEELVHIIPDSEGNLVDDARSKADQVALADFITSKVRELTDRENTTIFASLAGGRKTMTFFLGYAMSLFGRRQDSLSHVLVSDGYENLQGFYYPTPEVKALKNREGIALDAKNAVVELADIPFIRMREEMPTRITDSKQASSYIETVELMNLVEQEPRIDINLKGKDSSFKLNGQELTLTPVNMMFYTWMALRAKFNLGGIPYITKGEPIYKSQKLLQEAQIFYQIFIDEPLNDISYEFIRDRKAQVKKELNKCLPNALVDKFNVKNLSQNKYFKFNGIDIKSDNIIVNIESHAYCNLDVNIDFNQELHSYVDCNHADIFV